jgi:hypothetical protein
MSVWQAASDVMYFVVLFRMSLGSDLNITPSPGSLTPSRWARILGIAHPCFTLMMRSRRARLGKMRLPCAHAPS